VTLCASLPTIGPGALKNREDVKILGTAKESTLLQAATTFYKTLAIDCSRAQVSVDMWLFSSAYTDLATLSKADSAPREGPAKGGGVHVG
jgi:protein transport protein SEC24